MDTVTDAFNPRHALATLGQRSTELGKDFILLVKCPDLSFPNAILEAHPSIPHSKALMVTLVPRFRLPDGPRPEIVFIADRSGSMTERISPLKSSLSVFLRSLPVGVRFNICSFGSTHSFLWNVSQPYTDSTLREAQRYVDGMQADLGGTEILPPIISTISKRLSDLPLEIMVLTDGQVWNSQMLFGHVEKWTARGHVRIFTLGVGHGVSLALIDGLARVGRGFSQVVSDDEEMESKVTRMLRGGLSPHVNNYKLQWEGKPDEEDTVSCAQPTPSTGGPAGTSRRISLFDSNADLESTTSFSDLTGFVVPSALQAPYHIPPLFPFARTTAYVILSDDLPPPSHVFLRGRTPSGDELELEIPVQLHLREGQTIHQLAARKILQELEEGTGYLHSGKCGISRVSHPATFDDWVKREGVRVGLKYGLASKWTSFLAVIQTTQPTESAPEDAGALTGLSDEDVYEFVDNEDESQGTSPSFGGSSVAPTSKFILSPSQQCLTVRLHEQ